MKKLNIFKVAVRATDLPEKNEEIIKFFMSNGALNGYGHNGHSFAFHQEGSSYYIRTYSDLNLTADSLDVLEGKDYMIFQTLESAKNYFLNSSLNMHYL